MDTGLRTASPKMVRISLRKEASQAALEHPAEASRKPPDWTYFSGFPVPVP